MRCAFLELDIKFYDYFIQDSLHNMNAQLGGRFCLHVLFTKLLNVLPLKFLLGVFTGSCQLYVIVIRTSRA